MAGPYTNVTSFGGGSPYADDDKHLLKAQIYAQYHGWLHADGRVHSSFDD